MRATTQYVPAVAGGVYVMPLSEPARAVICTRASADVEVHIVVVAVLRTRKRESVLIERFSTVVERLVLPPAVTALGWATMSSPCIVTDEIVAASTLL
jgi:hypothetical protein